MPWLKFHQDYDWRPKTNVIVAYKAGMTRLVTTPCAAAATAAGAAVRVAKPKDVSDERRTPA